MSWTDESVADLKSLWLSGSLSTTQLAEHLNEKYNMDLTKNAIIGKVNRLGLAYKGGTRDTRKTGEKQKNEKPKSEKSAQSRQTTTKPKITTPKIVNELFTISIKPQFVMPETSNIGRSAINSFNTNNICRWPFGDPQSDDFRFCEARTNNSLPYCEHHMGIAYQKHPSQKNLARS